MELGSYPVISLSQARELAFDARKLIEARKDPIEERNRLLETQRVKLSIPNFAEAARRVHGDLKEGFRNKKQVTQLTPADFAGALKPVWLQKPETASRVKQRCDAVMNWCAANGYIVASPVSVVTQLLPKQPGKRERVEHQPAVPWRDMPAFVDDVLRTGLRTQSKLMLEVLILTAARSGEVRQMEWPELDFENGVWTLPAQRMKAKVAHRAPLSPYLVELLESHKPNDDEEATALVFPSRNKTPISDRTLTKCLRNHNMKSDVPGRIATVHGFRSSFRDWASENGYPRDLAERALAHTIRNATEAAYHRTDLLEQRREMMLKWENWVLGA